MNKLLPNPNKPILPLLLSKYSTYKQGQYNDNNPKIREYFYFIDHNGMLFLDDTRIKNFTSCFKEKKFLNFFYNRLHKNKTPTTNLFPFVSLCGPEHNYTRTDDNVTPIVFTNKLVKPSNNDDNEEDSITLLEHNNTGTYTQLFTPSTLYIGSNGRVYHLANINKHFTVGLVKSSLADSFISDNFVYTEGCSSGRPVAYLNNSTDLVKLDYSLEEVVESVLRKKK